VVCPITSSNKNFNNNIRDLGFGYLLVAIIFGSVGIFGVIGILELKPNPGIRILD
jgi:hypothetical protein